MFQEHHFNIGLLDNLVMVEDFLTTLDSLLVRRICIFCHRVFRTAAALKRHMKQKRHYKIDSKNHHYDKYYVVNYSKCGGATDKDVDEAEGENDDWEDLSEEIDRRTVCLFCPEIFNEPKTALLEHMKNRHNIDWEEICKEYLAEDDEENSDSTYEYIKLVTFLRKQMQDLCCSFCLKEHQSYEELEQHLAAEGHCKIPEKHIWNKPEYLFPLYDDDPLLFDFAL